ncbi:MAG: isoprenylcysteine carboxylmethyltransferase family protein [Planctomycetes bacterium]|nr:isoprenylcysteine carboxylmethyltransferase family protein [Planctomycetota bacterium]
MMRATLFEFRNRFWFIGAVFGAGFSIPRGADNVAAIAIARAAGFQPDSHAFDIAVRSMFAFGALLAIACGALRTWASAYLTSNVIHDHAIRSETIVADGPYRRVRNPLYLALILLATGFALLAGPIGAVVIVLGIVIIVARLIGREEAELAKERGAQFEAFCNVVPRIVPAVFPRLPASGAKPKWGQAFLGELFIWGFACGLTAFVITLDATWILGFSIAGFAAYFIQLWFARKRKA